MQNYPGIVRTRVSAKANALLLHYASERGISPGELARELIEDGLDRMEEEPTIPLWLELLAVDNYRTRALLLRLLGELSEKRGWTDDYFNTVMKAARKDAEEYARRRLAEIERTRQAAPRRTRR